MKVKTINAFVHLDPNHLIGAWILAINLETAFQHGRRIFCDAGLMTCRGQTACILLQ